MACISMHYCTEEKHFIPNPLSSKMH